MARRVGSIAFTRLAMSSVEASPFFRIASITPRRPSRRTILVCTANPSCTCATSRMKIVLPFTWRTGMSFMAAMTSGLLFRLTVYSRSPILAEPVGRVRFWTLIAALTSCAESP